MDLAKPRVVARRTSHRSSSLSELGVSFATVNRWEGGKNLPRKAVRERIAALAAEAGINPAEPSVEPAESAARVTFKRRFGPAIHKVLHPRRKGCGEVQATRLAHARVRQDLHAAHRRASHPRTEAALPQRDRHPHRRPHRA